MVGCRVGVGSRIGFEIPSIRKPLFFRGRYRKWSAMIDDELPEPKWLWVARRELGVHETAGPASTARIQEYLATTGLPKGLIVDETPWCAAFVEWCLQTAGSKGTGRASARSYLRWGKPLGRPRPGCIAVMSRPGRPGSGHVGFYLKRDDGVVRLLGGNQNNAVCGRDYPISRVLGYRWPV